MLSQPNFNLKWMENSFTYKASNLWNKLSHEVKQAKNNVFGLNFCKILDMFLSL